MGMGISIIFPPFSVVIPTPSSDFIKVWVNTNKPELRNEYFLFDQTTKDKRVSGFQVKLLSIIKFCVSLICYSWIQSQSDNSAQIKIAR